MQRSKLWSRRNLPEELWPEILSRLPVKTLLRFRCVSKQWQTLIDDPGFARLHLLLNRSEGHLLVHRLMEPLSRTKVKVKCIQSLKVTSRLHIPRTVCHNKQQSAYWYVCSSIDGLFMLKRIKYDRPPDLMLWNPATRKTLILPPSPQISTPVDSLFFEDFGLGFDPSVKDYKHVRLIQTIASGLHSVAVYSLATKSWKMSRCDQGILQQLRDSLHGDDIYTSLCLKGFLFHLALTNDSVVPEKDLVSFDFRTERLASIKLPVDVAPHLRYCPGLTMADDGCSLSVVFCLEGSGSVWVLEGLGDDGTNSCIWSKRYTISSMIPDFDSRACWGFFFHLMKNGELLIRWKNMITSYDLKTKKEKIIDEKKYKTKGSVYIESLVAIP